MPIHLRNGMYEMKIERNWRMLWEGMERRQIETERVNGEMERKTKGQNDKRKRKSHSERGEPKVEKDDNVIGKWFLLFNWHRLTPFHTTHLNTTIHTTEISEFHFVSIKFIILPYCHIKQVLDVYSTFQQFYVSLITSIELCAVWYLLVTISIDCDWAFFPPSAFRNEWDGNGSSIKLCDLIHILLYCNE